MKTSRATIKRLAAIGLPITIPSVLIERLKQFGARFIKVATPIADDPHSGKNAVEKGFQDKPYRADDPQLQEWLRNGNNYGVLAGDGLVIVETDTKETTEKMNAINTFAVQSGSGRGQHFYILSNATENGVVNIDNKNVANIQVERKYVVGAGCRHFTGNVYKIVNDVPIAFVSKQTLDRLFGVDLTWAGQRRIELEKEAEQEKKDYDIPIDKVIDLSKLTSCGGGIHRGSHPIHGSISGRNFDVNTAKNVWHCFRCNTGGGALSWIAVKHGIIECHEAPLTRKDKRHVEALEKARQEGFDVNILDEELSPDVKRFFEKDENGHKKFYAAFLADELMKETHFLTEMGKEGRGLMFRYDRDNGIYLPGAEDFVNSQTSKKLGKHYTINRERETEAYIKARTLQVIPETDKEWIAVKNHMLNVRTRELESFSPNRYVFNALPVIYDPSAECPKFLKFLSEVVSADDQLILQEHSGDCLHRKAQFGKALMLIGSKQNGKSTFLYVLATTLGKENVSAISLQNLSDSSHRFTVARLHNKMANICADLPPTPLKETDLFKKVATGDMVTGEFKFKTEFDFIPFVKLVFSANLLPPLPKDVEPFIVRWNIVDFPNQFLPGDPRRDTDLKAKLTTPEELSGILNWMLDGLARLIKQDAFSKCGKLEEIEERWRMSGDSQKAFVERELIADLKAFGQTEEIEIEQHAVYAAYLDFCKERKLPIVTSRTFARQLPEYISCVSLRTSRMIDGLKRDVHVWRGIRFRKPEEKEE